MATKKEPEDDDLEALLSEVTVPEAPAEVPSEAPPGIYLKRIVGW